MGKYKQLWEMLEHIKRETMLIQNSLDNLETNNEDLNKLLPTYFEQIKETIEGLEALFK